MCTGWAVGAGMLWCTCVLLITTAYCCMLTAASTTVATEAEERNAERRSCAGLNCSRHAMLVLQPCHKHHCRHIHDLPAAAAAVG
jgi:hypothetical protein